MGNPIKDPDLSKIAKRERKEKERERERERERALN